MNSKDAEERLQLKSVKPTANRILVFKALAEAHFPMTLADLEERLVFVDKSSIFRTLTVFAEHDVVHSFEDGRGIINYELCHDHGECRHHDQHMHFFCERCHRSFCLQDTPIQSIKLPDGFQPHELSFVIKGICAECSNKEL